MKINIPVGGKDEVIDIPEENINAIIKPVFKPGLPDAAEKIKKAVLNPIGTKKLSEIVKEKFDKPGKRGGPYHKVAVATDNWDRPTKHYLLFPPVLEELQKAGVKDKDIVIVEGCGVHRPSTPEEWNMKWGKELRARFKDRMYSHTAPPHEYDKLHSPVKVVGFTRNNSPVSINKYAAESDVLILLGQVSMYTGVGYSGGAKIIVPGIASYESIALMHALNGPGKHGGPSWENNVSRLEINEFGEIAGVDFIVNVIHNVNVADDKVTEDVVAVAAGHYKKAWASLLPTCNEMYLSPRIAPADIYIASASYKPSKALSLELMWVQNAGDKITKPGGTLIIAHRAEWPDHPIAHLGCPYFKMCEDMFRAMKPRPIEELVKLCYYRIGWESFPIFRVSSTMNGKEIVVTGEGYGQKDFEGSGFKYIPTLDEAIEYAFKKHGKHAKANISPYAGLMTVQSC